MHEYLMEYEGYFGHGRFQVTAENREEALKIGNKYLDESHNRDNIIPGTLKAIRKLKPSFGKS